MDCVLYLNDWSKRCHFSSCNIWACVGTLWKLHSVSQSPASRSCFPCFTKKKERKKDLHWIKRFVNENNLDPWRFTMRSAFVNTYSMPTLLLRLTARVRWSFCASDRIRQSAFTCRCLLRWIKRENRTAWASVKHSHHCRVLVTGETTSSSGGWVFNHVQVTRF